MRWIALFALLLALVSWSELKTSTTVKSGNCLYSAKPAFGDTLVLDDLVFSDFFSPNGDGHNDTYIILNVESYTGTSLKVFNRWGEVVYLSSPYMNDWDGTNNQQAGLFGKKLPDGIYYFEFYNGNGKKATGKITLKR